MKKLIKKYWIIPVLLTITLIGFSTYMYNKPRKNIIDAGAKYKVSSKKLFADFESNENQANKRYLNQVIEVAGSVKEVSKNQQGDFIVVLDSDGGFGTVRGTLIKNQKLEIDKIKEGEAITLKGICTGMLLDIILVDCYVIGET
ncbi:MAG: OB-fold putative lipoprotein [Flammeovirgaceae bacterium]|nr:OB-fold putative lipoprotein [Flammeovirgaceae bacterium]